MSWVPVIGQLVPEVVNTTEQNRIKSRHQPHGEFQRPESYGITHGSTSRGYGPSLISASQPALQGTKGDFDSAAPKAYSYRLDRPPQRFDKDVVATAVPARSADPDLSNLQPGETGRRGERAALVRTRNLWIRPFQARSTPAARHNSGSKLLESLQLRASLEQSATIATKSKKPLGHEMSMLSVAQARSTALTSLKSPSQGQGLDGSPETVGRIVEWIHPSTHAPQ